MTIDVLAIVAALVLAVLGWRSGAVAQCLRVVCAAAAFVGAAPLARFAHQLFWPDKGLGSPVLEGILIFGAGVVIYVVLAVIGWFFVRTLWAASDSLTVLDRIGGAALGMLKAALVAFFLVSIAALVEAPLEEADPEDKLHLRDGYLLAAVKSENLLVAWRFGDLRRLHDALATYAVAKRNDAYGMVRSSYPKAADFLSRRSLREWTDDDAMLDAAVQDRYDVTLARSRVRAKLDDPDFVADLREVAWGEILDQLEGEQGRDVSRTAGR